LKGSAETSAKKEKNGMRKIVVLLTGMVFVLGVMVPMSYGQYKVEKNAPMSGIPKQETVHIGVEPKDKKGGAAAKTEQKAPAAPDQKAVTAGQPAPADTKAQDTKKTNKSKKGKKTKKAPKE
jgi:hypothetical protein